MDAAIANRRLWVGNGLAVLSAVIAGVKVYNERLPGCEDAHKLI